MIRSVILSYICCLFPRGASVAGTESNRNAIAGTPRPALRWKRERTAGVGEQFSREMRKSLCQSMAPVRFTHALAVCSRAARRVFFMSMVMVMGPTPPGTGVMAEATGSTEA